jgi:BirA family biotin operon repressor/biotin-[acetyl-CoA-carboxylase] ligase
MNMHDEHDETTPSFPTGLEFIRLDRCVSTNDYLKENFGRLKEKLPVLVTSALQTGGRGRDQRYWVSTEGKGLYSSFGFSTASGSRLYLLPLIAGISVIETLKYLTGLSFDLKWPNDVLFRGKKVAGILIENTITDASMFCIVGIGINLNHKVLDFPPELTGRATSLKIAAGLPGDLLPEEINPYLATGFLRRLDTLSGVGEKEVIREANRCSRHLIDQSISFHQRPDNKVIEGIFKGINHDGGLILELKGGRTTIYHTGEIIAGELR